ncbi:bacteriohemerythrin [Paramagnetospirillum magneticum]|uniref:Hemerythrin-like protein RSc0777 n=1 Tax=Paramagnetospirillum magneticum (strain ATCC 700264 / AMB-1) TaxID=342108 RepID=Q2W9V2_PARM1|nr:bacteriohemerythrin [Paramagnetospirillum magneticum]BAE49373.1 Hemerythrin-like protein RSc0777 [Paramagnetospirillum magneticum AMB-1]
MSIIAWTEAMSVDNPALDKDHQKLIRMINELDQSAPDFLELFNAVLDYTTGHFDREETHLDAIGFPGLDAHRVQHDDFADQVAAMLKEYRERPFDAGDTRLKDFLWSWLKGHILIEDQRYAAWTRARGG